MSTGNLVIVTTAKRLVSAVTSKSLKAAVSVGRFIKEIALTNVAAFSDSQTFSVGKGLSDSGNFSGEPVITPLQILADSAGFTDSPTFSVSPAFSETLASSDSGVILAQDYTSADYFDSDYLGTKHTF